MNGDPQKRKVLYEALTKDGYALGTLEEFSSKMDMPDKAKALYDGITKDGYDVGDFETFSAKVGPPKTQALPSMTTPLTGAAAGPATSSAGSLAAPQEPSLQQPPTDGRAFTEDFFADQAPGPAPAAPPTMAPGGGRKPVQQAVEEANFFNAVQAEKKNQRIAPLMMESEEGRTALKQLVEDVNLSKASEGIGNTGQNPGAVSPQVFAQYQQVQFDPTMQVMDPRMDKIHYDFEVLAPKVGQRKTQFSPQERQERIEAGTWQTDPKNELNYQADALQFQGRLLAGRKLKLMEMADAGADPVSLQAEAADIDAGEAYVRGKLTELGQRDPRSFAEKLREESQAVSDKENSVAGDAARGFVFSAAGTLRSGLAGAARLIDPGEGYTFSDKLSDWAANIDKDRAALRSKDNKDSILGKLADGAGSMTAYIMGGGVGTPAMVATALTTEYESFTRQAMDQGATEDQAEAGALAYAPISAAIELVNPQTYFANRAGMTAVRKTFIDMVKSGAKPQEALKYALDATQGGLREALEELSQTATERATNYAVNQMAGTDLNTSISAKEAGETVLISALLGGAGEAANRAATKGERSRLQSEAMMWAAKNTDQAKELAAKVAPAEADAFGERLDKLTRTYKGNNLTEQKPQVAAKVADLVHEKQDIETAIKEAPMDPSVEAAVGDPRKRKAAELTTAMIEAMGIPADKAKAALIGAGMEKAPEGTKVVTNPDGSVTLEKKPEAGEKKKPTAAPAESSAEAEPVSSEAAIEPTTNENEPTTQAPAATQAEDTGVAPGVPLEQPPAAEPVVPFANEQPASNTASARGEGEGPSIPDEKLADKEKPRTSSGEAIPARSAEMTDASVINRDYRKIKEELGEKKAKKYFEQVDRLFNPNKTKVVEYRKNGVVTESGGKRTFHALADMDNKRWRVSFSNDLDEVTPSNDTSVGKNAAGEQLYDHADGSRYRVRFDRKDRPNGYPDFGGDLNLVSESSDTNTPAQGESVNSALGGETGQAAPPTATTEPGTGGEVNKTFTTKRAYEGEFRDEVKAALEKGGLTRDIENQEEAAQRADAFIADVGIDVALEAAKEGDVRGGARSVIVVRALEDLQRQLDEPGKTQEEITDLAIKQAELIQWRSQILLEQGREASMMNYLYANSDLGFNSEAKANEWRKEFGEEPSPEMMARWKERDKEFAELKQKLADAEKRAEEAQAAATMKAIQDSVARQKSINRKTTPTQRSKVLADKIRTLKIGQRGVMSATIVPPQLWDAAVEAVAQTVQAGGNLATAIQAGLKKLRESDWYKKLQQAEQQESETSFSSAVEDAMRDDVESGPIRIPKQMIHEAVANGAKDIDSLVATIKEQLKEKYPDATDREIRDAITEYGKVVNMSKDELSVEVRRLRDIGRLVSAIEDAEAKKRPLRSGLQRDRLDAHQRDLRKQLREAMKDLPVDTETQARELRTALDAAKTRARNRIEDLQREIDTKQRTPRNTTSVEPDAELQALIAEKEELEKEHDAIFGDKSLTDEERLKRAIDATRRSVEALEQKVRDKNVDPAKPASVPETPELKALRERREKLREEYRQLQQEAGVIDRRRLDAAKKAAKTRIQELERRIDQGDFSKKEAKPPVVDNELIRLQAEKMRLKEEYDKEFYKNRLLNRTMPERVKDSLWEAWGLTRALRATGELSFVLMQGGLLTTSYVWHKPAAVGRAFKTMWQAMRSKQKSEDWSRWVKAQDWYPMLKKGGVAFAEPHAELSAREELFMSDWSKIIWNTVGKIAALPAMAFGKKAYDNAVKAWATANLFNVVERGASGYLTSLRIERALDGIEMVRIDKGREPTEKEVEDIADVANTLTGRATIGKLEPIASTLTKMFFSPRLWASAIKTATPYGLHHFGLFPIYTKNAETGKWGFQNSKGITPTARKLAVQDLGRFIGTTMGFVALAAAYFNNDDDDETGVETDPRSADFGKIKVGDKYIDPWGGRIQQLVFATRMTIGALSLLRDKPLDAYKDRKKGDLAPLGQGMTPTMTETALRMAQNKLAPSASFLVEAMSSKVKKDGTRTSFGKPYDMSEELVSNLYPIYVSTVADLAKEDPGALEGFLAFYAFFGGGVNVDAAASPAVESPEDAKKRIEAMSAAYK